MNIDDKKCYLEKYGTIIEYDDLKCEYIKEEPFEGHKIRPLYFVMASRVEIFIERIQDPREEQFFKFRNKFDCVKKDENKIEGFLNVKNSYFIPDEILREDILFFYKLNGKDKIFIVLKDEYIYQMANSEHTVFGIIDFSKGKELFLKRDNDIKQKMKIFHKKIEGLASKYQDMLFVTISDSVLIKYSFNIESGNDEFQSSQLDFERVVGLFKEIRKIVWQIFQMSSYGVFTYGQNKSETLDSYLKNLFHTGILCIEFKKMLDMETGVKQRIRKQGNTKKGDMYLSHCLYKAFRFYLRKKYQYSHEFIEPSAEDWGFKNDRGYNIVALTIPDEPLKFKK